MKKVLARTIEGLLALAVVGGAILWLSGGFNERVAPGTAERATAAPPEGAGIVQVEQRTGPVYEPASGAVASARQTVVASRILARIEEIRVRAGDAVTAGELLVTLDSRDLAARVAQAREAVRAARARRDLAQSERRRYEQLLARGVATQQRADQAKADYRAAQAEVDRLEQGLAEAETALSYTEIRAPVSGLVVERLAEPGDTAAPGGQLLRIYDPSALRVEVAVRESLAVKLRVGGSLNLEIPSLAERFDGKIQEIVPFAEPGARTLLVKVGLPPDPRIYAGLYARVAIPAGTRTRVLMPQAGVERIGQLTFASVVEASGQVERRPITTGRYRENGLIEVLSGLAPGERVVAAARAPG